MRKQTNVAFARGIIGTIFLCLTSVNATAQSDLYFPPFNTDSPNFGYTLQETINWFPNRTVIITGNSHRIGPVRLEGTNVKLTSAGCRLESVVNKQHDASPESFAKLIEVLKGEKTIVGKDRSFFSKRPEDFFHGGNHIQGVAQLPNKRYVLTHTRNFRFDKEEPKNPKHELLLLGSEVEGDLQSGKEKELGENRSSPSMVQSCGNVIAVTFLRPMGEQAGSDRDKRGVRFFNWTPGDNLVELKHPRKGVDSDAGSIGFVYNRVLGKYILMIGSRIWSRRSLVSGAWESACAEHQSNESEQCEEPMKMPSSSSSYPDRQSMGLFTVRDSPDMYYATAVYKNNDLVPKAGGAGVVIHKIEWVESKGGFKIHPDRIGKDDGDDSGVAKFKYPDLNDAAVRWGAGLYVYPDGNINFEAVEKHPEVEDGKVDVARWSVDP